MKINLKYSYLKLHFQQKNLIISITKIIRIIIIFIKFIISISFIKVKTKVDVKKLIYYNYNQAEHIKRDCF